MRRGWRIRRPKSTISRCSQASSSRSAPSAWSASAGDSQPGSWSSQAPDARGMRMAPGYAPADFLAACRRKARATASARSSAGFAGATCLGGGSEGGRSPPPSLLAVTPLIDADPRIDRERDVDHVGERQGLHVAELRAFDDVGGDVMLEVAAEDPELQAVAPAVEMAPLASRAKGVGRESRLLDGAIACPELIDFFPPGATGRAHR